MLKMTTHSGQGALSATDQAYNGILDLVLHHELRSGERTSVNMLADRLELGRTPVKEAITRLQTEGLLSVAGRSGTMVNSIDAAQAEQLFALRQVLEDFAADEAVKHFTTKQVNQLKKLTQEMRRQSLDNTGDHILSMANFVKANVEFHALIVEGSGNRFLLRLYSQIQIQLQIVTYLMRRGYDPRAAERRQNEHEAIVKALEARDGKALKAYLRSHADTTKKAILAALAEKSLRSPPRSLRRPREASGNGPRQRS
jgi:DNA-binding GntR family transcriptional regulator